MKVLITGANGFVGAAMIKRLRREHDLTLLSGPRGSIADNLRDLRWIQRDLRSPQPLDDLVQTHDAVVHLAGLAHVRRNGAGDTWAQFHASNVETTRRLAVAASNEGVRRFVMMSSIAVNGMRTSGDPFKETDTPDPASHYGLSKQHAEEVLEAVCDTSEMDWVALRPPVIVGANAPGSIAAVMKAIALGFPLPFATIRNRRSYLGLGNLADFVELSLRSPAAANQVFTLADMPSLSTPDMIQALAAAMGRPARLIPAPLALIKAAVRASGRTSALKPLWETLEVDSAKAALMLGWRPEQPLEESFSQAAAAFIRGRA